MHAVTVSDAGDDRLHLGHDRPAEGLRDQPRQPDRGGPRHHWARRGSGSGCWPGTPRSLLFLPLSHILARVVALCLVACRQADRLPRRSRRAARPRSRPSARPSCSRCHACSRRSPIWGPPAGRGGWPPTACSPRPRPRRSPGARRDARRARWVRLRHTVFGRLVYCAAACHTSGATWPGRSEAGHRWARSARAFLPRRRDHHPGRLGHDRDLQALSSLNLPGAQRIGSVGVPLPGYAVQIASDGEILVTGSGRLPEGTGSTPKRLATRSTATGSAPATYGRVDYDGFVYLAGRKKELIITATGAEHRARGPGRCGP